MEEIKLKQKKQYLLDNRNIVDPVQKGKHSDTKKSTHNSKKGKDGTCERVGKSYVIYENTQHCPY